jgi:hypothetical protein
MGGFSAVINRSQLNILKARNQGFSKCVSYNDY